MPALTRGGSRPALMAVPTSELMPPEVMVTASTAPAAAETMTLMTSA